LSAQRIEGRQNHRVREASTNYGMGVRDNSGRRLWVGTYRSRNGRVQGGSGVSAVDCGGCRCGGCHDSVYGRE
jgi:hypothetical protein